MAQGVQIGRGYIAVTVDESGARAALRGFVGFAGNAFKTAVVAAGGLTAAAAKIGISFNSMQEQASIAFTTLLGDGQKAQQFLLDLQQFSAKTPFELPGLINNARMLLGVGLAADKVIPTLTSLGNAAGALGIDQERFNNILLATTQAMGKGKLQGEELMQMVENGIPVWQLLSKATGKSVEELQKLSSEGKLLAADTLPLLFAQMDKDYGGAMVAQSKTLQGSWSSLKDNAQILAGAAFKPLFNEAKGLVGVLGELAASDKATAWAQDFADGLQRGIDAAKIFGLNLKERLGDDAKRTLETLRGKFYELWPSIESGAKNAGTILTAFLDRALPALLDLAQSASGLLRPAIEAVNTVLEALARNADEIAGGVATAAQVFGTVAAPAVKILGEALKLAADALSLVVDFVGDISGPLGAMAGAVLAGVVAWRALSTVLGGISGIWKKINPADVADGLKGFATKVDDVALSAGVMTERLTGSANAGQRVASAGSKIGSALTKVGSALPAVGIAVAAVGAAMEISAQAAEDMAAGLLKGGKAAETARTQISGLRDAAEAGRSAVDWVPFAGDIIGGAFEKQANGAEDSAKRQVESMSSIERAQLTVSQATANYSLAVERHGAASSQAIEAERGLASATRDLETKQRDAAAAARSHEESLYDLATAALAQANADVALRQAELNATEAQEAYTVAVRDHGVGSKEAQQASINLENSYIRAADAAAQKALADNAGKSSAEQAAAATKAYNDKLIELTYAAGTNAPPALLKMLTGLDNATIAAMNAAAQTSGFKTQVVTLPDGRTVHIAVDDAGRPVLDAFKAQYDKLVNKTVTIHFVTTGNTAGARSSGGGTYFERASGGPVYSGQFGLVGESGAELITRTRGGYVHDADRTAQIMSEAFGRVGGDGGTVNQYITPPPSVDAEQVADIVVDRLSWRRG